MTDKKRRPRLKALVVGLFIAVVLAEIVLRFFPVSTGMRPQPVNAEHTVFQFEPSRSFVFSRDWNFAVANKGWINNDGFVNDQDYVARDDKPLLAVVGDSFIEAAMVPYAQTVQGRLAQELRGQARVYSFAASGAPLSQYLVWAKYAHDTYAPDALVISVVGNDFDESLAQYSICPGQHHFVPDGQGGLQLQRFDFEPNLFGPIVYSSAFARYLHLNLKLSTRLSELRRSLFGPKREDVQWFVGNTPAAFTPERLADADMALDTFFRLLPEMSGLPTDRILFVLDGMRPELYDAEQLDKAGKSFFATMRGRLITKARGNLYETIDLQAFFVDRYRRDGSRFEFPTDYHWNATGHGVAARAIQGSALYHTVQGLKRHGEAD